MTKALIGYSRYSLGVIEARRDKRRAMRRLSSRPANWMGTTERKDAR